MILGILTIIQLKWKECIGQDSAKKQNREEICKGDAILTEIDGEMPWIQIDECGKHSHLRDAKENDINLQG